MIQEKNKEGMEKLESFLYNQLNNGKKEDENNLKYIQTFRTKTESSHFFNEKRGALLGYFSAVNVIKKITEEKGDEIIHIKLLDEIMTCISISLKDHDNNIIYAAAQCMYNIIIYFKSYKYVLNNFKNFFEALLILVTIDDEYVNDIAKDLDCSLKGVINYSFQDIIPPEVNLLEFFKEIILNIKRTEVEDKCTVVSWISCINQIPGIKLINILHLFLGDLFDMLKIDNEKLQKITNECLEGFYREIEDDFEETPYNIKIAIFKIVIKKCEKEGKEEKNEKEEKEEKNIILKAFKWANLFLQQYKFLFIRIKQKLTQPKKKQTNIGSDTSINKVLSRKKDVKSKNEKNEKENNDENDEDDDNGKLPFDSISKFLTIIFDTLVDNQDIRNNSAKGKIEAIESNNIISSIINNNDNDKEKEKEKEKDLYTNINNCNNSLLAIIEKYKMSSDNIKQLETVLMKYLYFENKELLFIVIKWIEKFFNKFGEDAFSNNFKKFIEKFTSIAIYKDEEIFEIGIKTLYNIEKCRKGSMNVIILNILNKLKGQDNSFAIKRTKEFVKALCRELNVKYVYSIFAEVLYKMSRSDFVCKIINILNMLLLTSNDTEELRNLLKNIQNTKNKEDKLFFDKLFTTWCINPVSCLILCLIAEDFELSNHLLIKFGQLKSKLIQENYLEYAQLIQILETNAFISKKIYKIIFL